MRSVMVGEKVWCLDQGLFLVCVSSRNGNVVMEVCSDVFGLVRRYIFDVHILECSFGSC